MFMIRSLCEFIAMGYEGAMSAMRHSFDFRSGLAGRALIGLLLSSP